MLSNLLRGHKGRERVDVWGVLENRIEEDGATNSKSIFVLCGTLADIFTAVWASTGLQSKPLFFGLVHQVRDWFSGAAAYFGWMREAKRENTRCGLRPMSDKAASQKTRSPEGCDENGPAAALLLSHVSIQICSFVAPCRRPILIATP